MGLTTNLPPFVAYALSRLSLFILPSTLVWAVLTAQSHYFSTPIPKWLLITLSLSARPLIFFFNRWTKPYLDARAAKALGAVSPPKWNENLFSIMGQLEDMMTGYPVDLVMRLEERFGATYFFTLISDDILMTSEPEFIKAMLATQFDNFEKGDISFNQMKSLLGNGIFNVDGDMWKFHRSMARPFFTKERISDFEIYERNWTLASHLIKTCTTEECSFDFQDLVARFTLDSATEFLFGLGVDSLSAGLAYSPSTKGKKTPSEFTSHRSNVFLNAFTTATAQVSFRSGFGGDWPLVEPWGDKVAPLRKTIDDFVQPIMDRVLKNQELKEKIGKEGGVVEKDGEDVALLEYLAAHTKDQQVIRDELINLLVAGRDTTSSLLTFSVYMLSRHPEIEKRLRDEIVAHVGLTDSPSYEQMRGMKYMRAFLNEVLRLYPPVAFDGREAKVPVVLTSKNPEGPRYYVAKGTTCLYSVMVMQRRKDLWGPDAEEFDPDRFLDERLHKYLTPNPFIFLPFNAGPRICLGQQFAYHQATFFLTKLLQNFTGFRLDAEANLKVPGHWAEKKGRQAHETVFPKTTFTLFVDGGLWVYMKELAGAELGAET